MTTIPPSMDSFGGGTLPNIPGMPKKLPKNPPSLIFALETIFKTYGEIVEVRSNASLYRKGQAFVTFKNQEDATRALKEAQGFVLFDKPMMIQYSRSDSFKTVELEGRNLEEYINKHKEEKEKREKESLETKKKPITATRPTQFGYSSSGATGMISLNLPNKILFLEQVPGDVTKEELEGAFSRFNGFVEVRMVPGRTDIAFVEYDNEALAGAARASLGSKWEIRQNQPRVLISFARR
ncbi:hypothetical protein BB559_000786 [Furculomyces boomerangus]|uniref:RRM domain-containing protein n=2 Tax=Harpellales TaxID=61421 RepID=A0A2T9Z4A0_9FUNG|nr:hypothetical protein BB559_000786 [Furculomyces boomerangus]PWA02575.1 hypothetical protein BB558_001287 [Smittium angustum]